MIDSHYSDATPNVTVPKRHAAERDRMKIMLAAIEAARRAIAGHVLRTPLLAAPPLSRSPRRHLREI